MPNSTNTSNIVPAGTIIAYAGKSIPTGWELCDGREVNFKSEPKYKALYASIGNLWGGAGNPNFKLPDLRDMFLRGVQNTDELSQRGGSLQHDHGGKTGNAAGDNYGIKNGGANPPAASGMSHQHKIPADNHLPPFVKVVYLVKL